MNFLKKTSLFLWLVFVLISNRQSVAQTTFLSNGLVAYYPFNGNANDESIGARNGQLIGGGTTYSVDRFERPNRSVHFDGNGFVSVTPTPFNVKGDFSVLLWTKLDSLNNDINDLFSTGRDKGFSGLNIFSAQVGTLGIWSGFSGGFWTNNVGSETTHLAYSWHHIAFTKGAGSMSFYLDGKLTSQAPLIASPNDSGSLWIGRHQYDAINYSTRGSIDDVRIYNRSLSAEEVAAVFRYESTLEQPTPRAGVATAQVVNGFVVGATVIDGGAGYTENPVVSIVGGGGVGAKALATQLNGSVTKISITNPGSGYTSAPTIILSSPPFPPRRATASSSIVNGFVVAATLTDGGAGYQTAPTVLLIDGGGTGATAEAVVSGGSVVGINITNPGKGYTTAPRVSIASPPFSPELAIRVKTVSVHMKVVLGRKYRLESSVDMVHWNTVGNAFVAQEEELIQDFEVDQEGRFFRIQQIP